MNVLITGASGFVGGFIVEYALQKDWTVFAAIRPTSNRQYLSDPRINFVNLDFSTNESIRTSILEFGQKHGNLDYVIHNAGLTKTIDIKQYDLVNYQNTRQLVKCLEQSDHKVKKFTLISSMAAAGPGSELDYQPISSDHQADPVSAYGWSKKKAEVFVEQECQLPYIILRPPPVFGPRDRDVFTIFELVNKGVELYAGGEIQKLSFVYVKDLARGIIEATLSDITNKKYFISDNKYYDNVSFHEKVKKVLEKKTVKITLPLFVVYWVAYLSQIVTKVTGKPAKLSLDAYKELTCLNWTCDSSDFYNDLAIEPLFSMEQALKETSDWYKSEGWLK